MSQPGVRFNPPPNWPPMPAGWSPPTGWKSPPGWPAPPPGHQFWLSTPQPKKTKKWPWVLAAAAGVFLLLIVIAAVAPAPAKKTPTASTPVESPTEAPASVSPSPVAEPTVAAKPTVAPKPKPAALGIGHPVRDGKFEFTVTKVRTGISVVGDQYLNKKAQGQFVFVYVTVKNIGNESRTFDDSSQRAFDSANRKYDADTEAGIYLGDSNAFLNDINPGNVVNGIVIFDVPRTTRLTQIELHDSMFSGGVKVRIA